MKELTINFTDADTSKELHQHLDESSSSYSYDDCRGIQFVDESNGKLKELQVLRAKLVAESFQETLETIRYHKSIRKRQAAASTGMYIQTYIHTYYTYIGNFLVNVYIYIHAMHTNT